MTCPLFHLPAKQIIPKGQTPDNKDQRGQRLRDEQKKCHADPKTKKHKPQNTPHGSLLIPAAAAFASLMQSSSITFQYQYMLYPTRYEPGLMLYAYCFSSHSAACTWHAAQIIFIPAFCPSLHWLPQSPGRFPWPFPKPLPVFRQQIYSQNPAPCQEPWSPHPAA